MNGDFRFIRNRVDPTAPFLVSAGRVYSYRDLWAYSLRLQEYLPPDRPLKIALGAHLTDVVVLTLASCWLLEIPVIPFAPTIRKGELQHLISTLKPDAIFSDHRVDFPPDHTAVPHYHLPDPEEISLKSSFAGSYCTHPEKTFGYFQTSGTSGPSKIVPLKRRQFLWGAEGSASNFCPSSGELWLLSLPLHHVGGVSIIIRSLLYGSGIFIPEKNDARETGRLLSEMNEIRYCSLVPTILHRILSDAAFRPHPDFKMMLLGGGPMAAGLIHDTNNRGMSVATSFGMTETAAQIAAHIYHPAHGPANEPADLTAGTLFPPNQMQIRDDGGKTMPPGQEGLLWLKGPQVFDGYLDPDGNDLHFDEDGWFSSGDYALITKNGELKILMRRTDRIVTGGENVNPVEVEQALCEHPDVLEAAVFGIPDDEWGQRVAALIVRRDQRPDFPDLSEHLSLRLRRYQIPKEIIVADSLPYTRTGKIDRSRLSEWVEKNKR